MRVHASKDTCQLRRPGSHWTGPMIGLLINRSGSLAIDGWRSPIGGSTSSSIKRPPRHNNIVYFYSKHGQKRLNRKFLFLELIFVPSRIPRGTTDSSFKNCLVSFCYLQSASSSFNIHTYSVEKALQLRNRQKNCLSVSRMKKEISRRYPSSKY